MIDLDSIQSRLEAIEKLTTDFNIRGWDWSGRENLWMYNPLTDGGGIGATLSSSIFVVPPPNQGACCLFDNSCTITSQRLCEHGGGTYQGDGTLCDPNPCGGGPATGACCNQGVCTITDMISCFAGGGYYIGDGVPCSPDPCSRPTCCGNFFGAFDGSGRKFLTSTAVTSGTISFHNPSPNTDFTFTISVTNTGTWCPGACSCGGGTATYACTGAGCGDANCSRSANGSCGSAGNFCGASGCAFASTSCFYDPCTPSVQTFTTTVVSATEQYTDYTFTFGAALSTGTYRVYEYRSHECT